MYYSHKVGRATDERSFPHPFACVQVHACYNPRTTRSRRAVRLMARARGALVAARGALVARSRRARGALGGNRTVALTFYSIDARRCATQVHNVL